MRTLSMKSLPLSLVIALASACDEAFDEDADADFIDEEEGAVAPRCIGSCFPVTGLGNTSRIGDHALTNAFKHRGAPAANLTAENRWIDGDFYYNQVSYPIEYIEVRPDGELRLWGATFFVGGEDTKDARLRIKVTPYDANEKPFIGELVIADVKCEPGAYDPSVRICSYDFVTDVKPADPKVYQAHEKMSGYYHTCPNQDEGQTLSKHEKYSSVLSDGVALDDVVKGAPSIRPAQDGFIIGCINGAVSKTQYKLNAFYDPSAYRGLHSSQATPALLAWMAWFDGRPQTVPGQWISLEDPINGLFKFTSDPAFELEAGYSDNGARCRGSTHRYVVDPAANLPDWKNLPECAIKDYQLYSTIGVKAIPADK